MRIVRRVALALLSMTMVKPCQATSVVVGWTPTQVVIGADSKGIRIDGKKVGPICKITVTNDVVAAKAGLFLLPAAYYNINDILSAALDSVGSLDDKVKNFEDAVVPKLSAALKGLSFGDSVYYKNHFVELPALEVVFAAQQDGLLRIEARDFAAVQDSFGNFASVRIGGHSCPSVYCANPTYFAIGQHKTIDERLVA